MNRPLLTAGSDTQIVHLSVDKLTVLADFHPRKTRKTKDGEIELIGLDTHYDFTRSTLAKFPYQYNLQTTSGLIFQLAPKDGIVPRVRMEWNPNDPLKHESAMALLPLLTNLRPTRIDMALDYQRDLSGYIMTTNRQKKTCTFAGSSGKLETLYIGSKDADSRYRIYDKRKEMGEGIGSRLQADDPERPSDLWRIEQQLRLSPKDMWQLKLGTFFADLYLMKPSPNLAPLDRLVLEGLLREPETMGLLTRRQKEKYRGILKDRNLCAPLEPWPSEIYNQLLQPIADLLTTIMKG